MNTVELFSGTESFSKVARELGYSTFTIDNNFDFKPDLCMDILDFNPKTIESPYILWASPPCTAFSVCSISKHWRYQGSRFIPQSDDAILGLRLLDKTIESIKILKPEFWFIENPRGIMRKVITKYLQKFKISPFKRVTVTYCKYGDSRQKPTDIWTNFILWNPKKPCNRGDSCHEKASRGSNTGTCGLKNAIERARIPSPLFIEIFKEIERYKKGGWVFDRDFNLLRGL